MDVNETLREARELSAEIVRHADAGDGFPDVPDEAAIRLAELFRAMDRWITRGGFLPVAWTRDRT